MPLFHQHMAVWCRPEEPKIWSRRKSANCQNLEDCWLKNWEIWEQNCQPDICLCNGRSGRVPPQPGMLKFRFCGIRRKPMTIYNDNKWQPHHFHAKSQHPCSSIFPSITHWHQSFVLQLCDQQTVRVVHLRATSSSSAASSQATWSNYCISICLIKFTNYIIIIYIYIYIISYNFGTNDLQQ